MKLTRPLLVTNDLAAAREFYEKVLNQRVVLDFGADITFDGGFSLQTLESWAEFIRKTPEEIRFGANDAELYFEEAEFDGFAARLASFPDVLLLHDVFEHPWGQRVVRFYDPDRHVIEVGEPMEAVIKRFLKGGMTPEKVAKRTMFPLEFICSCKEGFEEAPNI
jgi:catechol 2,3-dioxygenase-like lactoylglutathione lyase family enzyme